MTAFHSPEFLNPEASVTEPVNVAAVQAAQAEVALEASEWHLRTDQDVLAGFTFAPYEVKAPEPASQMDAMEMLYYGPNSDVADRGQYVWGRVKNDSPDQLGPIMRIEGRDVMSGGVNNAINTRRMQYGEVKAGNANTNVEDGAAWYWTEVNGSWTVLAVPAARYGTRPNSALYFLKRGEVPPEDMAAAAARNFPRQVAGINPDNTVNPQANIALSPERSATFNSIDHMDPASPQMPFEANRDEMAAGRRLRGRWHQAIPHMTDEQRSRIPQNMLDKSPEAAQAIVAWKATTNYQPTGNMAPYTPRKLIEETNRILIPDEELRPSEDILRSRVRSLFIDLNEHVLLNQVEGRRLDAPAREALLAATIPEIERICNYNGLSRSAANALIQRARVFLASPAGAHTGLFARWGMNQGTIDEARRNPVKPAVEQPAAGFPVESLPQPKQKKPWYRKLGSLLGFGAGAASVAPEANPFAAFTPYPTIQLPVEAPVAAVEASIPVSAAPEVSPAGAPGYFQAPEAPQIDLAAIQTQDAPFWERTKDFLGLKRNEALVATGNFLRNHRKMALAIGIVALGVGAAFKFSGTLELSGRPVADPDILNQTGGGGPSMSDTPAPSTEVPADTPYEPRETTPSQPEPTPSGPTQGPTVPDVPPEEPPQPPEVKPPAPLPATETLGAPVDGRADSVWDHSRERLIAGGNPTPTIEQIDAEKDRILDLNGWTEEEAAKKPVGTTFKVEPDVPVAA